LECGTPSKHCAFSSWAALRNDGGVLSFRGVGTEDVVFGVVCFVVVAAVAAYIVAGDGRRLQGTVFRPGAATAAGL
jgi:hypothetical protein